MPDFVEVPCQVCGSHRGETALEHPSESTVLGRVNVRLVVCTDCGFLFASPRPTQAALAEHRAGVPGRSRGIGDGAKEANFAKACAELVARQVALHLQPSGQLLDVGADQGDFLCALDLPRWKTLGLEPSAMAAARARTRALTIAGEPLEGNHLPPESFDLVTCFDGLEHTWDLRETMQELERLVRPRGLLVLHVPDATRPAAGPEDFCAVDRLSYFSAGTLQRLLRDFGFRTLTVESRTEPGLFVVARKEGRTGLFGMRIADDRTELHAAVSGYAEERERRADSLRTRLGALLERWSREGARVAILGTGAETRFLLDALPLRPLVAALLVPQPSLDERGLLDLPLLALEELATLAVDAVVLPPWPAENEAMQRAVAQATRTGAAIVRTGDAVRRAA